MIFKGSLWISLYPWKFNKGAIRTALLAYRINNEPSKYARFKSQSIDKWRNNGRDIEIAAFGNPRTANLKI